MFVRTIDRLASFVEKKMDELKKLAEERSNYLEVFGLALLALLPILIIELDTNPKLVYLAGWFFWAIQLAVSRIDKLYFLFYKSWLKITRKTVSWTMSGEFDCTGNQQVVQKVYERVLELYSDAQPWGSTFENVHDRSVNLPETGAVIRLFSPEVPTAGGDPEEIFRFQISELKVPFNQSEKSLNHILSLIENGIKPIANPTKEKYTFKVGFGNSNPYFGLFVRQFKLPKTELTYFKVEFTEQVNFSKERVEVSSSKLNVVASSLFGLRELSRKYITLSVSEWIN